MSGETQTNKELKAAKRNFYLSLALLGLGGVYAVWPLDFIADVAPVIGWVDDLGILSLAALKTGLAYRGLRRSRQDTDPESR